MFSYQRLSLVVLACIATSCGRPDDPLGDLDPLARNPAGSCLAGCLSGFKCSAGKCTLDPSALWRLTVTSGKVSTVTPAGDSWDAFGGAPDPYVCLTIGSSRSCTSTVRDSFQPVWNEVFPSATTTALLSGVTVSVVDEDISNNDQICGPNVVPVTETNFLLGTWKPTCTSAEFSATLTAQ